MATTLPIAVPAVSRSCARNPSSASINRWQTAQVPSLAIAEIAKAIPGYLGEEAWENSASGLISTVYYWQTLEALQQLVEHPLHRAAKDLQGRWIRGYHITIAQVLRSYGDGGIAHPLGAMLPGHE